MWKSPTISWTHQTPFGSGCLHHHSYPHHHPETKILTGGKKQGSHQCAPIFWWLDERCGETKNGLSCQSPQNKDHTMTRYKFHLNDLVDCMCILILIQPGAHQSFIPGSNIKMSSWKSESYTRGKGYKWINLYFTVLKFWFYSEQFKHPIGRNFLAT